MGSPKQTENAKQLPVDENFERVYVTWLDDFTVSDGEKELVISINVEFAFDVPIDGKFVDDNFVLVSNNSNMKGDFIG